ALPICPDTAHLAAGGCNPAEIFERYIDRVQFVHLKDLKEDAELESTGNTGFDVYNNFMELGQGDIDLKAVFKILKDHECNAYMTVELDRTRYTNKESAIISRKYLDRNF
ncbi:MAG: TIM barrel protein, partial [Clostridia bacterium]|nr:TIM barrel protein [Clostridia bacterium]